MRELRSEGPDFAGLSDRTAPTRCIPLMSPAAALAASVSFFTSLHATGRRGAGVARWRLVVQRPSFRATHRGQ